MTEIEARQLARQLRVDVSGCVAIATPLTGYARLLGNATNVYPGAWCVVANGTVITSRDELRRAPGDRW